MNREAIMEAAADPKWNGIPYKLPPDPRGISSIDCSLYVLMVFEDAGQPFPPRNQVRTAEQIRQVSTLIDIDDVLPGDLLFYQGTYPTPGASHIGISMGRGTGLMWDAHFREARPNQAVGRTDIRTDYWSKEHWMEARRFDRAAAPGPGPAPAPTLSKRMKVDATGLNVREYPNIEARVLRTLTNGTVVQAGLHPWREVEGDQIVETGRAWQEVKVNDIHGWAAAEFLEDA